MKPVAAPEEGGNLRSIKAKKFIEKVGHCHPESPARCTFSLDIAASAECRSRRRDILAYPRLLTVGRSDGLVPARLVVMEIQ